MRKDNEQLTTSKKTERFFQEFPKESFTKASRSHVNTHFTSRPWATVKKFRNKKLGQIYLNTFMKAPKAVIAYVSLIKIEILLNESPFYRVDPSGHNNSIDELLVWLRLCFGGIDLDAVLRSSFFIFQFLWNVYVYGWSYPLLSLSSNF